MIQDICTKLPYFYKNTHRTRNIRNFLSNVGGLRKKKCVHHHNLTKRIFFLFPQGIFSFSSLFMFKFSLIIFHLFKVKCICNRRATNINNSSSFLVFP